MERETPENGAASKIREYGMKSVLLGDDPDRLFVVLPAIDSSRFEATVADFADPRLRTSEFDCVVPFELSDYADLRLRADFEQIKCLIPPSELVALLDNKYECNRLLASLGFEAFVPRMLDRVTSLPTIYKKKRDAWGLNSFICNNQNDINDLELSISLDEYFKQEYISGNVEYVTHMLTLEGWVIYHSTYRYTFKGRFYVKGERCPPPPPECCDCPCVGLLTAIMSEMRYTGTSCFNYKMVGDEPKVFDINPRFGHSPAFDINNYLEAYLYAMDGVH